MPKAKLKASIPDYLAELVKVLNTFGLESSLGSKTLNPKSIKKGLLFTIVNPIPKHKLKHFTLRVFSDESFFSYKFLDEEVASIAPISDNWSPKHNSLEEITSSARAIKHTLLRYWITYYFSQIKHDSFIPVYYDEVPPTIEDRDPAILIISSLDQTATQLQFSSILYRTSTVPRLESKLTLKGWPIFEEISKHLGELIERTYQSGNRLNKLQLRLGAFLLSQGWEWEPNLWVPYAELSHPDSPVIFAAHLHEYKQGDFDSLKTYIPAGTNTIIFKYLQDLRNFVAQDKADLVDFPQESLSTTLVLQ